MQPTMFAHNALPFLSVQYQTTGTSPAGRSCAAALLDSIADFLLRRNHLPHISCNCFGFWPLQGLQSGPKHTIIESVAIPYYSYMYRRRMHDLSGLFRQHPGR